MITLLILNYLTRVQSEYCFSSDANVSFNVIEKNGMIVLKRLVGIRSKLLFVCLLQIQFAIIWYYFHNYSFNRFPGIILQKK